MVFNKSITFWYDFKQYLNYFYQNIPWLDEVSIGHALISDALYLGLERTVKEYKNCLR